MLQEGDPAFTGSLTHLLCVILSMSTAVENIHPNIYLSGPSRFDLTLSGRIEYASPIPVFGSLLVFFSSCLFLGR